MDKFGDISPERTPRRDPSETTIEELDDSIEKKLSKTAEDKLTAANRKKPQKE